MNKTPEDINKALSLFKEKYRKKESAQPKAMGAYGKALELVAGPIAGAIIGLGLDKLLGTYPICLIVLTPIGMIAGIYNIQKMEKKTQAKEKEKQ